MKIVTFGEIMLRLAPEGYLRFLQADKYGAVYGGGEANVAVSLARFGEDSVYVTKLPKHEIGEGAIEALRKTGVDTSKIVRGGARIGIYFCEKGASQRPSKVIYDRAHSAFAESDAEDYDWDAIFTGADWFHFTGITPALGKGVRETLTAACKVAKDRGITVSCDLNYRKALWTRQEAREAMTALMPYVDVLISNEEDAYDVFGISGGNDVGKGEVGAETYRKVAEELISRFDLKYAAITLRGSISANDNRWSAILTDANKNMFKSKEYLIHIVDRVGGGDSFGAGLIYGLNRYDAQKALEFAVAASCLKQTIEGDFNAVTVDEVLGLAEGNGSGRIKR